MPYTDGNPTLGEQIEEDARRRFYIEDLLKEANALARENRIFERALKEIADGEGIYGAQAYEYKQIARAAIAKAKGET